MNKSLKKIISVFMTLVLALGILAVCPVAATADIAVKTDRTEYLNNDTVTATVYFPTAYNKVASLDMTLKYDSSKLEIVSVKDGAGLESALKAQTNGRVYSESHKTAGTVKWSLAGASNFSFSGTFATVVFNIKTKAAAGETTLTLGVSKAANSGLVAMTVNTQNAKIKLYKEPATDLKFALSSDKKGYEITGYDCVTAASVSVPESYFGLPIVGIAKSAFENHAELTSVTLPSTLEYIGESAFSGCSGLEKLVIPDSVDKIGANAFNGCTALTSVTLPVGLQTIEKGTFANCSFLGKVEIPFTVTKINAGAFENCYSLAEVKISKKTTNIASDAFKKCFPSLKFVTADDNKTIPAYISSNYSGAKIEYYKDFSLGTAKLSSEKMQYTGKVLKPSVTVTLKSGAKVTLNTNYKVVYKNNVEIGRAVVYVAGLGGYGEGYTLSFDIYCGHKYSTKTIGLNPTCTTEGYYNCPCDICGAVKKETIPATGHTEGKWVYDKLPTIYETGMKHTACTKCSALVQSGVSVDKVFPDLNNDKSINSSDALIVLQYATEIENHLTTEKLKLNADTNGDGQINSSDALDILQIAIGKVKIDGYTV